jgi:hypothetical protein
MTVGVSFIYSPSSTATHINIVCTQFDGEWCDDELQCPPTPFILTCLPLQHSVYDRRTISTGRQERSLLHNTRKLAVHN